MGLLQVGVCMQMATTAVSTRTYKKLCVQGSVFQDPEIVNAFSGAVAGVLNSY